MNKPVSGLHLTLATGPDVRSGPQGRFGVSLVILSTGLNTGLRFISFSCIFLKFAPYPRSRPYGPDVRSGPQGRWGFTHVMLGTGLKAGLRLLPEREIRNTKKPCLKQS